jgi:photosystem II stability/assembly factor-like uncharacterized protein
VPALSPPLLAASDTAAQPVFAIESPKAAKGLMIDVVHAGSRLVAVGDRGHILYSDDQGSTWTQAKVPTRQLLTAVFFVDDKHGWAVGHDAQILASVDGGATWAQQYQDLKREAPLLDVWFNDANHGLAVGAYGALIETTDGGKTWEDVSERLDNEDQFHLNAIAQIKDAGLFIVGEQGSMFPLQRRRPDLGKTRRPLRGFTVRRDRHRPAAHPVGLRLAWQPVPLHGFRQHLGAGRTECGARRPGVRLVRGDLAR